MFEFFRKIYRRITKKKSPAKPNQEDPIEENMDELSKYNITDTEDEDQDAETCLVGMVIQNLNIRDNEAGASRVSPKLDINNSEIDLMDQQDIQPEVNSMPNENQRILEMLNEPWEITSPLPAIKQDITLGLNLEFDLNFSSKDLLQKNTLTMALSFLKPINHSTWIDDAIFTGSPNLQPTGRNAFNIVFATGVPYHQTVYYNQLVYIKMNNLPVPLYLAAYPDDEDYAEPVAVCLTTRPDAFCVFKFMHRITELEELVSCFPIVTHSVFIIQHLKTRRFLAVDFNNVHETIFGTEPEINLQYIAQINMDPRKMSLAWFSTHQI